jgi:hypothetical protein
MQHVREADARTLLKEMLENTKNYLPKEWF